MYATCSFPPRSRAGREWEPRATRDGAQEPRRRGGRHPTDSRRPEFRDPNFQIAPMDTSIGFLESPAQEPAQQQEQEGDRLGTRKGDGVRHRGLWGPTEEADTGVWTLSWQRQLRQQGPDHGGGR